MANLNPSMRYCCDGLEGFSCCLRGSRTAIRQIAVFQQAIKYILSLIYSDTYSDTNIRYTLVSEIQHARAKDFLFKSINYTF